MRNIKQNLFFSHLFTIRSELPIAAGILYPFFGLLLSPMIVAAAAMSFSSVSVITNALRLRRFKPSGLVRISHINLRKFQPGCLDQRQRRCGAIS